jgi:hypothetical protein
MFTIDELLPPITSITEVKKRRQSKQYINHKVNDNITSANTVSSTNIDNILEDEKQKNIKDTWNKLDKTSKIQKLNNFATKYCKDSDLQEDTLIDFFKSALENNKLQKKKDINYDMTLREIISIPSLSFKNNEFSISSDRKRVSTLKSLTPKRIATV